MPLPLSAAVGATKHIDSTAEVKIAIAVGVQAAPSKNAQGRGSMGLRPSASGYHEVDAVGIVRLPIRTVVSSVPQGSAQIMTVVPLTGVFEVENELDGQMDPAVDLGGKIL